MSIMHLSILNLSLFYTYNIIIVYLFVAYIVHGFVRTTDLELTEGATQEVIRMILDIKGNTLTEPASTRVLNFGFSFTCIDSSNGGGPQAIGELWMYVERDTTFSSLHTMGTFMCLLTLYKIPVV